MSTFEVPLTEPIKVIDTMISTLIFTQPKGRHLIGLPDPETDKVGWSLMLASRCVTNVPSDVVLDLDAGEAVRIGTQVALRVPTKRAPSSTDTSSAPAAGETPPSST